MYKTFSLFVLIFCCFLSANSTTPIEDIYIRDPFILADEDSGNYYMYCSSTLITEEGQHLGGVGVYKSKDLKNWEDMVRVCTVPKDNWITGQIWAPEVHKYKGKYYLFATINSDIEWKGEKEGWGAKYVYRGTQIFSSDSPEGPFEALSRMPATPIDEMALDGTLWSEDGTPYMVYCHEWVQIGDGEMKAIRLSDDLSETIGNPVRLFNASAAKWSTGGMQGNYVSDGCYLYRTKNGKLIMIWSSFMDGDYALGLAESTTGKVEGPWRQKDEPIFKKNGGHGMIFKDFDGNLRLVLHMPNSPSSMERAHLFDLEDTGDTITLKPD